MPDSCRQSGRERAVVSRGSDATPKRNASTRRNEPLQLAWRASFFFFAAGRAGFALAFVLVFRDDGGFGLSIAQWMSASGAGKLVLASRSGKVGEEEQVRVDAIKAQNQDF